LVFLPANDIKISSEIGMRLPLLAGAGGRALLSQLSDEEIDRILIENPLKQFTSKTCIDKTNFKKGVLKIREEGIAFDDEEYIDGIVAFSIPLKMYRSDLQAAIWAVGLKPHVHLERVSEISDFLKKIVTDINQRFYMTAAAGNF
jgi:IclR family KDG regulon transcriptional repressor